MAYIWQSDLWDIFSWDMNSLHDLSKRYEMQKAKTDSIFELIAPEAKKTMQLDFLSNSVVSNGKIEGVNISYDSVYSSVANALNIELGKMQKKDAESENNARISISILNENYDLSENTIFRWHELLFSATPNAKKPKHIGEYRSEPIYVINFKNSFKEEVLYEGLPANMISQSMFHLFSWINQRNDLPLIIKSAIASFWFLSVHPFEDGNGRLSRFLSDAILQQGESFKYFTMTSAIERNKEQYYLMLQRFQNSSDMDITEYVAWYIKLALEELKLIEATCIKKIKLSAFIFSLDASEYNSREITMLYKLASGSFYGKLTAEKWSKINKCKSATATRDLSHLVEKGMLVRSEEGGRAVWYALNPNLDLSKNALD